MRTDSWEELKNLIGTEDSYKNVTLLNVALTELSDTAGRFDLQRDTANFVMSCVGDPAFALSPLGRLICAQSVATHATGHAQETALQFILDEFNKDKADISRQKQNVRFGIIEPVFAFATRSEFSRKYPAMQDDLLKAYIDAAKQIALFDMPHALQSLAAQQKRLPQDIRPEVKNAIVDAMVDIATSSPARGAAAIRDGLLPGKQAGTEARAEV